MTDSKAKAKGKRASRGGDSGKSAAKSGTSSKAGSTGKPSAKAKQAGGKATSGGIDDRIRALGGWRGEILAEIRRMIHEAAPEIIEEIKWVKPTNPLGVPVWSHTGIVCTGESYKQVVKLTFARGASLKDPQGLFNSSLEGNMRRAIDIREGEKLDAKAFKALIREAIAENVASAASRSKASSARPGAKDRENARAIQQGAKSKAAASETTPGTKSKAGASSAKQGKVAGGEKGGVVLLSGGNPQIAKADGDAPVQAYIAAMPGWKSDLGKRLDAIIERNAPNVRKAVKWNSPFYGIEGQGWFLSFHVLTRYVKVTFFNGTSLRPVPPGGTPKSKEARWIDIYEGKFDEAQMATWVKQAAKLPGWVP